MKTETEGSRWRLANMRIYIRGWERDDGYTEEEILYMDFFPYEIPDTMF